MPDAINHVLRKYTSKDDNLKAQRKRLNVLATVQIVTKKEPKKKNENKRHE